jgi:hypothetical protein
MVGVGNEKPATLSRDGFFYPRRYYMYKVLMLLLVLAESEFVNPLLHLCHHFLVHYDHDRLYLHPLVPLDELHLLQLSHEL